MVHRPCSGVTRPETVLEATLIFTKCCSVLSALSLLWTCLDCLHYEVADAQGAQEASRGAPPAQCCTVSPAETHTLVPAPEPLTPLLTAPCWPRQQDLQDWPVLQRPLQCPPGPPGAVPEGTALCEFRTGPGLAASGLP